MLIEEIRTQEGRPKGRLEKPLALYALFHLNMAFSAIEEEQRAEVISSCYWPLLAMINDLELPLAIEATGHTLEIINDIDPAWVDALRRLVTSGQAEFVGSGYAQIIGPLVPAKVNAANLEHGHRVYEDLLDHRPALALVNEQAYSPGLVGLYRDAGYQAIMMEWNNSALNHPEWDKTWAYLPQHATGLDGEDIPLIWNNAIAFQKMQRYAHDEMSHDNMIDYLAKQHDQAGERSKGQQRCLSLYGNDAEIFDFRPGRYATEPGMVADGEWSRLHRLFATLKHDDRFELVKPSSVLGLLKQNGAGNRLALQSPENPVPVKKQNKYNLSRWAVTGRGDLVINSACWRLFQRLDAASSGGSDNDQNKLLDQNWRKLCYLWSSDYRTHITERRWARFRKELAACEADFPLLPFSPGPAGEQDGAATEPSTCPPEHPDITTAENRMTIETEKMKLVLNSRRGLAIDGFWVKDGPSNEGSDGNKLPDDQAAPLCGTLHHGFFDDITMGSDWFSGTAVLESPDHPKITDLAPVNAQVTRDEATGALTIVGKIETTLGTITKSLSIPCDRAAVTFDYELPPAMMRRGSLRLGNFTIHPDGFNIDELFIATHNGGVQEEYMPVAGHEIDHGAPVSFLVSSSTGLGMTNGSLRVGDGNKALQITTDMSQAALMGMVVHRTVGDSTFCRLSLSALEMDETRPADSVVDHNGHIRFTLAAV